MADAVVLLRPWAADDVPPKLLMFSDPSIQRFSWPHASDYTEADACAFFEQQEQARLAGEEFNFAFAKPDDPTIVLGGGSVYDVALEQGRAAVGFWLGPAARGRGVATHATKLMARWAFDELGISRLELTCAPDNQASQRVAERCGFVREGVLRSHVLFKGERRDTVMFSLLRGELS